MEYTIIKCLDGRESYCTCKRQYSIKEFGGYCESCWVKLKPSERAAITGKEIPQVELVVNYPKSPFLTLSFLWKLGLTASVAYLFYKTGVWADVGNDCKHLLQIFHH